MLSKARWSNNWLLDPKQDFWLIHAGCGLLFLPVVIFASRIPQTWTIVSVFYALLLSKPHLAATFVRIGDAECRKFRGFLLCAMPVSIAILVYLLVVIWKLLGLTLFILFMASLVHQSQQNFGIMRAYVAKSGLSNSSNASLFAGLSIQTAPLASVFLYFYLAKPASFFSFPFWLPPQALNGFFTLILVLAFVFSFVGYLFHEYNEWSNGNACGGRLLTVLSGLFVYVTGYQIMSDIHWGYVIASSWHCIQYLAFNHAYRSHPPAGAELSNISPKNYALLIIGLTCVIYFVQNGFSIRPAVVYPMVAVIISFHHYFADAFLWRSPRSNENASLALAKGS